jgi:hypothetical protein
LKKSPTKISNSANRSKPKNWFFSKAIRPSKEFINKRSNCKWSLRRRKGKKTNSQRKRRFSKKWYHKTKLFCQIICLSIRVFGQVQERSANPTKKSHFRKAEKERDLSPEKAPSQRPSNLKKSCISPQNSSLKSKNNTSFEAKKCSRRRIGERIWQTNWNPHSTIIHD